MFRQHLSLNPGAIPTGQALRRGSALIIAMVCLVLASVLTISLVQLAVLQRGQVEREEWQLQAECLVQSGVDRAAAQLAADPDYSGEEWLPALPGTAAPLGRVTIEVEHPTGANELTVTVVADVPSDADERARSRTTTTIRTPQPSVEAP